MIQNAPSLSKKWYAGVNKTCIHQYPSSATQCPFDRLIDPYEARYVLVEKTTAIFMIGQHDYLVGGFKTHEKY